MGDVLDQLSCITLDGTTVPLHDLETEPDVGKEQDVKQIKKGQSAGHGDDDELMLNVLRCQLTYQGQVVTNAEARCNKSLRPRKPEGSLGRTAQDVHLDSHTAPELCRPR